MDAKNTVECYRNENVKALRQVIDEWTIQNLIEYPYLYVYGGNRL